MAAAAGEDVNYLRYLEGLRREIIARALREGKKVFVNGIAIMSGLRGSFSTVDGAFDPSRHKLAVTSYAYGDIKDCLADIVPENTVKGGSRDRIYRAEEPGRGKLRRHPPCQQGQVYDIIRGLVWKSKENN